MKFCAKCGSQMEDNSKFCPNCGSKAGAFNNLSIENKKNDSDRKKKSSSLFECCICGKKTINSFVKDGKAYCKSCLKLAGMDSRVLISKKLMNASELEIRNAVNEGIAYKAQEENRIVMEFKGSLGKIELYENKIVIKRGVFHASGKNQKEIYFPSIMAIEIKKPGIQAGYIQFVVAGSQEVKKKGSFGMNLADDENTVLFNDPSKYKEALEIRDRIEKYKNKAYQQSVVVQSEVSVADELLKLKSLLDAGIISEEEFSQQKYKLLNK